MAEPFLAEIRIMSFGFAPKGWALCNGQLLPINQNQALFSLLGTTYGGDGRVNFQLPNLQSRMPMHMGNRHTLGEVGGEQEHTLSISELPGHGHAVPASSLVGNSSFSAGNIPAAAHGHYASSVQTALKANSVTNVGGSQAHLNMPPFLALNFCIALQGIFPSQT